MKCKISKYVLRKYTTKFSVQTITNDVNRLIIISGLDLGNGTIKASLFAGYHVISHDVRHIRVILQTP